MVHGEVRYGDVFESVGGMRRVFVLRLDGARAVVRSTRNHDLTAVIEAAVLRDPSRYRLIERYDDPESKHVRNPTVLF